MNDQIGGVLRALAPLLVGILTGWGLDSSTAGLVVTALGAVLAAVWSWYTNTLAHKATSVAAEPGVKVLVTPRVAPIEMVQLARDPEHPDVVISP